MLKLRTIALDQMELTSLGLCLDLQRGLAKKKCSHAKFQDKKEPLRVEDPCNLCVGGNIEYEFCALALVCKC